MPELPRRPSLERLKCEAKDLLAAAQRGEPEALQRVEALHPRPKPPFALHHAQLAVARAYGCASWPRLKERVAWLNSDEAERAVRFVRAACSDNPRAAREALRDTPALARLDLHTALVSGQADIVAATLESNPAAANTRGGPLNREPLLYVTHSRFLREADHAPGLVACARLLLEHGADPNASYEEPGAGYPPQTAVYGAAGVNHHPELTRLLLEAGANPNDNECLYHASETRDHTCLRLLMEYGINPGGTNALKRMLDFPDLEGVRLLLEYGADPNEYVPGALYHAILRGRDAATVELLIAHGAEVNARAPDGTTPCVLATRHGRDDLAAALRRHGARDETAEADRFLGACMRADRDAARAILSANPGLMETMTVHQAGMLADAAALGNTDAVRVMLEMGMNPAVMAGGFAAIHIAGWNANEEMVRILVDAGAPLEQRNSHGGTALDSTIHGAVHRDDAEADYPAVVRCLVAAGAVVPAGGYPEAPEEVREALAFGGA